MLIEGLCNSLKLQSEDDQMEIRLMDEFFCIESIIGEVAAVIASVLDIVVPAPVFKAFYECCCCVLCAAAWRARCHRSHKNLQEVTWRWDLPLIPSCTY